MTTDMGHLRFELYGCGADELGVERIRVEPVDGHDPVISENGERGLQAVVQTAQRAHDAASFGGLYEPLYPTSLGKYGRTREGRTDGYAGAHVWLTPPAIMAESRRELAHSCGSVESHTLGSIGKARSGERSGMMHRNEKRPC